MKDAQKETQRPYQAYGGERLAGPAGGTLESERFLTQLGRTGVPEYDAAQMRAQEISQYRTPLASQMSALGSIGYQAPQEAMMRASMGTGYQAPELARAGTAGTIGYRGPIASEMEAMQAMGTQGGIFGGREAGQYMDPYLEQVLERQKESIREESARQAAGRSAQATRAGAFGGSRQAIQDILAQESEREQIADVEATGRQQAFQQAQQQFERDRQARLEAQRLGLAGAEQLSAQDLRARQLGLQSADQLAQIEAQAQQLGLTSSELLSQMSAQQQEIGMKGAEQLAGFEESAAKLGLTGAELLANLGAQEFETGVQQAGLLEAVGKAETAREQQALDIAYQDYLRQRDYPREQLQFMSSILRGVPVSPSQEQASFQQVNPYQQLLGTGISGLSLYRALGGGS